MSKLTEASLVTSKGRKLVVVAGSICTAGRVLIRVQLSPPLLENAASTSMLGGLPKMFWPGAVAVVQVATNFCGS